jgi:hypothetical protein
VPDDDDRRFLAAIRDYCTARIQAADQAGAFPPPETHARRWAYARVATAARELLEEMEPAQPKLHRAACMTT